MQQNYNRSNVIQRGPNMHSYNNQRGGFSSRRHSREGIDFPVYVCNLSGSANEKIIHDYFSQVGQVNHVNIIRKPTRATNCGFVNLGTKEAQDAAIQRLNGTELAGEIIKVDYPLDQQAKTRSMSRFGGNIFDIFVHGGPMNMNDNEMKAMLEQISGTQCVRIINKGSYLFYQVNGEDQYQKALQALNGALTPLGTTLTAQPGRKRPKHQVQVVGSGTTKLKVNISKNLKRLAEQSGVYPIMNAEHWYIFERSQRTVHLSNIERNTSKEAIRQAFLKWGNVEEVNTIMRPEFQTGFGFVVYKKHEEIAAFRAESLLHIDINNCAVRVGYSKPKKEVADEAHRSGLIDSDNKPLQLFQDLIQCVKAGLDNVQQHMQPAVAGQQIYLQDPESGQVYTVTPQQYINYLTQQGTDMASAQALCQQQMAAQVQTMAQPQAPPQQYNQQQQQQMMMQPQQQQQQQMMMQPHQQQQQQMMMQPQQQQQQQMMMQQQQMQQPQQFQQPQQQMMMQQQMPPQNMMGQQPQNMMGQPQQPSMGQMPQQNEKQASSQNNEENNQDKMHQQPPQMQQQQQQPPQMQQQQQQQMQQQQQPAAAPQQPLASGMPPVVHTNPITPSPATTNQETKNENGTPKQKQNVLQPPMNPAATSHTKQFAPY